MSLGLHPCIVETCVAAGAMWPQAPPLLAVSHGSMLYWGF